jgi:hypothetical protein
VGPDAALRFTAPDGAADIRRGPLSLLRGYDNPELLLDPTAYAVGYSLPPLTGLRKTGAQERDFRNELLTQENFDAARVQPRAA